MFAYNALTIEVNAITVEEVSGVVDFKTSIEIEYRQTPR